MKKQPMEQFFVIECERGLLALFHREHRLARAWPIKFIDLR